MLAVPPNGAKEPAPLEFRLQDGASADWLESRLIRLVKNKIIRQKN